MAYKANPFLERMSEGTSDQDFVRLFSPKVLERLNQGCLQAGVHLFKSPPGGGKTTILRAFTPQALRSFWNARSSQEESLRQLQALGAITDEGPELLGVYLSCAAGYADLPPGASGATEGLFRALLDCRVVLRTLRSIGLVLGRAADDKIDDVAVSYAGGNDGITSIPKTTSAGDLADWAIGQERKIYSHLEQLGGDQMSAPSHVRFEGILWLQSVSFWKDGKQLVPKRLLMIDDIQRLRKSQRTLLQDELINARPSFPVWLASRSIAFVDDIVAQGARRGRDVMEYELDDIWRTSAAFQAFAQNVLDRRLEVQQVVPGGTFEQQLRARLSDEELARSVQIATERFEAAVEPHRQNDRYANWLSQARQGGSSFERIAALYSTRILVARDLRKKQLSFDLAPLPVEEFEGRDNANVRLAAELFAHSETRMPYYYGIDRLCVLATNNAEELLSLAASLFEGMKAKATLRRTSDIQLSPVEQEKRIKDAIAKKHDFIPKTHTEGTRAQKLIDAIGAFCKERTYKINAPYAPGVTGVRLSNAELESLKRLRSAQEGKAMTLLKVMAECVAENLLVERGSSPTTGREGGAVFYLNRGLCVYFDLPLQFGGWQDVSGPRLIEWMEHGHSGAQAPLLEAV